LFISRATPSSTLLPYTTLFRSQAPPVRERELVDGGRRLRHDRAAADRIDENVDPAPLPDRIRDDGTHIAFVESVGAVRFDPPPLDRKSTRLNSSHVKTSYAVFC